LVKDYFAVFGLWQDTQTGDPINQRKAEIINDVMQQVGKMIHKRVLKQINMMDASSIDDLPKMLKKFNHAAAMENWPEFTAALTDLLRMGAKPSHTQEMLRIWKDATPADVSPSLQGLFSGRPPKKTPDLKQVDKPLQAPSTADSQKELPSAGSQMNLPHPKEKIPYPPENLPPQETPFASDVPKRLGGNWENVLKSFGYNWSEAENGYRNDVRNVFLRIQPDYSVYVTFPSGRMKILDNLGQLFIELNHNRNKRHRKEPVAHVTTENYKKLYEFLYT